MRIVWTGRANADRHRLWMFIAERSPERADKVDARLERRVATLSDMPGQGRPLVRTLRELSIPDVQLVVRYRIDEDAIRILRVFHTRENREEP